MEVGGSKNTVLRRTVGSSPRVSALLCLLTASLFATFITVFPTSTSAATVDPTTFDHLVTGFPLTGEHELINCESCHIGGVFEVLPKECVACHDGVLAIGVSVTHIPTTASCDTCHTTAGFAASAIMDHSTIGTSGCATCHNGVNASGQSASHIPTTVIFQQRLYVGLAITLSPGCLLLVWIMLRWRVPVSPVITELSQQAKMPLILILLIYARPVIVMMSGSRLLRWTIPRSMEVALPVITVRFPLVKMRPI